MPASRPRRPCSRMSLVSLIVDVSRARRAGVASAHQGIVDRRAQGRARANAWYRSRSYAPHIALNRRISATPDRPTSSRSASRRADDGAAPSWATSTSRPDVARATCAASQAAASVRRSRGSSCTARSTCSGTIIRMDEPRDVADVAAAGAPAARMARRRRMNAARWPLVVATHRRRRAGRVRFAAADGALLALRPATRASSPVARRSLADVASARTARSRWRAFSRTSRPGCATRAQRMRISASLGVAARSPGDGARRGAGVRGHCAQHRLRDRAARYAIRLAPRRARCSSIVLAPVVRAWDRARQPVARGHAAADVAERAEHARTAAEQFRAVVAAEADVSTRTRDDSSTACSRSATPPCTRSWCRASISSGSSVDTRGPKCCDRVRSSEHARFPVFDDTLDDIIGILYAKDLLPASSTTTSRSVGWSTLVRPAVLHPGRSSDRPAAPRLPGEPHAHRDRQRRVRRHGRPRDHRGHPRGDRRRDPRRVRRRGAGGRAGGGAPLLGRRARLTLDELSELLGHGFPAATDVDDGRRARVRAVRARAARRRVVRASTRFRVVVERVRRAAHRARVLRAAVEPATGHVLD